MISNIIKNIVNNIVSHIRIPVYRFTVKTTVPGETFALPLELTGTYDFDINHGDGSSHHITAYNDAAVTHAYATPGTHEIAITGTITGWRFNNGGDCAKIYEIKSWGPLKILDTTNTFFGCVNMVITATDVIDISNNVRPQGMLAGCDAMVTVPSILSWDWSATTNASFLFYDSSLFNQDISGIYMPLNENLSSYLFGCVAFDQNLGGLNIASVTTMANMLAGVSLSVANYDGTLIGFEGQPHQPNVTLDAPLCKYTAGGAAATARAALVADGWTINDAGENLGSELITDAGDRDFSGGQGNWATMSGNDVTFDNVSMNWACDESNNQRLAGLTITEGTLCRYEFEIIAYTSGDLNCFIGNAGEAVSSEAVDTFVLYITAGTGTFIAFTATNFIGKIDNVSIKECL